MNYACVEKSGPGCINQQSTRPPTYTAALAQVAKATCWSWCHRQWTGSALCQYSSQHFYYQNLINLPKIEKKPKLKFCLYKSWLSLIPFIWNHNWLIWLISLRDLYNFAVSTMLMPTTMLTLIQTMDRDRSIIMLTLRKK